MHGLANMNCAILMQVAQPMDLETLLARVDARRYGTAAAYLADARLIAAAAAQFWAGDPAAVREVRRRQQSCRFTGLGLVLNGESHSRSN